MYKVVPRSTNHAKGPANHCYLHSGANVISCEVSPSSSQKQCPTTPEDSPLISFIPGGLGSFLMSTEILKLVIKKEKNSLNQSFNTNGPPLFIRKGTKQSNLRSDIGTVFELDNRLYANHCSECFTYSLILIVSL